jgi:hypothetical protein
MTKKQKPPPWEEFLSTRIYVPWRRGMRCANLTADDFERYTQMWEQARDDPFIFSMLIVDVRNAEPIVRVLEREEPSPYITVGVEVEIPEADDLEPRVSVEGFIGEQPHKLVFFGEKTSLEPVLGPIAEDHDADLYLPTGEISDTLLYRMASVGAGDGRPMIVFCFSDCDPSGWQMPISISRKLQGFQALEFSELDFQVYRVALTPDHVRTHGLPISPLKETEKRADRWTEATGVKQTEIDALAALNPQLLRQITLEAVGPFYDYTLADRVNEARQEWLAEAQTRLEEQIDQEQIDRLRVEAEAKLETLRDEIDAVNEALATSSSCRRSSSRNRSSTGM